MNKTDIDWCDYTWNPVTGCRHGCEYCYARRTAGRFGTPYEGTDLHVLDGKIRGYEDAVRTGPYPFGFAPTFHRYRLKEPAQKARGRNIFVCCMADLFGKWVPDEWIHEVFAACAAAPQHNYLFLTKNPSAYTRLAFAGKLPLADRFWYGYTVTDRSNALLGQPQGCKMFLSLEPLLGPLTGDVGLDVLALTWSWVIIGAMTGPGAEQNQPKREWVESIVNVCRESGIPVFMKHNLVRVWGESLIQEYPKELNRNAVEGES